PFNKKAGATVRQTPLPHAGFAHSTPVLIQVGGKPQLIVIAAGMAESPEGVQSFDPASGKRLWWCKGPGEAASPAYGSGIVYCDSGRGGAGIAVDPTGTGDVTRTHIKWRQERLSAGIGSPNLTNGLCLPLPAPKWPQ